MEKTNNYIDRTQCLTKVLRAMTPGDSVTIGTRCFREGTVRNIAVRLNKENKTYTVNYNSEDETTTVTRIN